MWWLEPELNRRHVNFQSTALPTELSSLHQRLKGYRTEVTPLWQGYFGEKWTHRHNSLYRDGPAPRPNGADGIPVRNEKPSPFWGEG